MMRWLDPTSSPLPTVAVTLRTGSTITGALAHRDTRVLILRGATLLSVDRNGADQTDRLDGEVVIPVENVDFWQSGLDATAIAHPAAAE